jgi:outer membrane scaffolding protein for murein synthesis (MipA/OmpV family)
MQTAEIKRGAALGLAALVASWPASAEQKPLWEFGLGIGSVAFEDYRGADTARIYPVPVPYFVYRGKFLESDRNGVKGKLLYQDRVELSISLNGTTPVRNSPARQGMPDLKPTVDLGPSLNVHVWRSADARVKFDVRVPASTAFTIEASPHCIGWFVAPHVNLDIDDVAGMTGWDLGLLTGPLFADRRYDAYFYSVAPQFARVDRAAYQARGGYSGTRTLAALSKRFPSFWTGLYVRWDTLSGASFLGSPLVKSHGYWSSGIGVAWIIRQSSRLVETDE